MNNLGRKGQINFGIDIITGKIENMLELNVIEPAKVIHSIVKFGTETSLSILRINQIYIQSDIQGL